MVKFIENLFGSGKKPKSEAEEYEELDLSEFEEGFKDEPTNMLVRVAELNGLDILPELKKQIYGGNIVFIDVSPAKHDKLIFDRAIKDLKQVVNDVHGDIALVKEDQVIVTPRGVRIDRQKLK
ncbi:MAG: cell division protein SepF [Euryarchaeota archaeon]|nr:cell division protein SepF [Euryarchaeota archaeon]MCG2738014.1 cell division protein SepF [Candidatus Methanoperedenaceae archaeon]